jgi:hypothetical protein
LRKHWHCVNCVLFMAKLVSTSKICLNQYLAIGSGNPEGDNKKSRVRVDVQGNGQNDNQCNMDLLPAC